MAAITQRIEVCDVCKEIDRPIKHYRLAPEGGRLRTLALCEEHRNPVELLISSVALWTGSRRSSRQVTMEQIEEVKKRRSTKKSA